MFTCILLFNYFIDIISEKKGLSQYAILFINIKLLLVVLIKPDIFELIFLAKGRLFAIDI